jgi:hypothetical protein
MDLKAGLICKLTGKIADFENECESYNKDEAAISSMNDDVEMEGSEITSQISSETLEKLRAEQSLPAAIFSGIFIGILAAIAWAMITVTTNLKIGLVAIAIGFVVGLGMRQFGKGIDPIYGICGAVIALFSCFFGDIFSIIGFAANEADIGYFDALTRFDYSLIFEIMAEIASPMDFVFYAIAAYEGYKFSFRQFTKKDLYELDAQE